MNARKKAKRVYGVGINDAFYHVKKNVNGKTQECPYYRVWKSMLKRCYCHSYKINRPTYIGVTVCDEWHSFLNFRSWMMDQDWKGKELDKDLIEVGNKIYSPKACAFVDSVTNKFIEDRAASRGELPLGVCRVNNRDTFYARCSNPLTKKLEHLGAFKCPESAHNAWKTRKHQIAAILADLQSDHRVSEALRLRYV